MKQQLVGIFLFLGVEIFAQNNQVELPYANGEVKFENSVATDASKKELFEKMLQWIHNDTSLTAVSIDKKTLSIYATGNFIVPVVRSRDNISYVFYCEVIGHGIKFHFNKFYNKDVGLSIEKIIEQNKNNERKTVQENLKFLKSGIFTQVNNKTLDFKRYIKEK